MSNRITITEVDNTSSYYTSTTDLAIATLGFYRDEDATRVQVFDSYSSFIATYPDNADKYTLYPGYTTTSDRGIQSYLYTTELLKLGVTVIYCNIYDETVDTSTSYSSSGKLNACFASKLSGITASLSDMNTYQFDYLSANSLVVVDAEEKVDVFKEFFNDVVGTRWDCTVLKDDSSASDYNAVNKWDDDYAEEYASYCIICAPYCYDTVNGEKMWMPLSFGYLKAIANSISYGYPKWYPVVGPNRGQLTNVSDLAIQVSTSIEDWWNTVQTGTDGTKYRRVLFAKNFSPYGYVLFSNSTAYSDENSVLISANARIIANLIKVKIRELSQANLFEINTQDLWEEFTGQLSIFLDEIVSNGGLYDYSITMDSTNNSLSSTEVKGSVQVWISRLAESFDITFSLMTE